MVAAAVWAWLGAVPAFAQDESHSSLFADVAKSVILDPTTVAPAMVTYQLRRLDWKTSQIFFNVGWVEHNSDFTVTGRADDIPVSYGAGNRKIRALALQDLQYSIMNNVAASVIEHVLVRQYPNHRKLWRTIGWIERISFAAYQTSLVSTNFNQWQRNERLARQLGYK